MNVLLYVTNCGAACYARGLPISYTIKYYYVILYTSNNKNMNLNIKMLMCCKVVKDVKAKNL